MIVAAGLVVTLSACGSGETETVVERTTTVDVAEPYGASVPPPPPAPVPPGADGRPVPPPMQIEPSIPLVAPKIAYTYSYGYRLPGEKIPPLQQRHADMCEALGPQQCRIIALDSSGSEGAYAGGTLQLAIRAERARAFGQELAKVVEGQEGEQVSASIQGEDLSKQLVDTEARLRARTVLRDRLEEVLETRRGTVAELVEAERGVAQVNEEIDQARSWLEEMKGRVSFSRMTLTYQSGSVEEGGFLSPIRSAWNALGSILGTLVAAILLMAVVAGPIALLVWLGVKAARKANRGKSDTVDRNDLSPPNGREST